MWWIEVCLEEEASQLGESSVDITRLKENISKRAGQRAVYHPKNFDSVPGICLASR